MTATRLARPVLAATALALAACGSADRQTFEDHHQNPMGLTGSAVDDVWLRDLDQFGVFWKHFDGSSWTDVQPKGWTFDGIGVPTVNSTSAGVNALWLWDDRNVGLMDASGNVTIELTVPAAEQRMIGSLSAGGGVAVVAITEQGNASHVLGLRALRPDGVHDLPPLPDPAATVLGVLPDTGIWLSWLAPNEGGWITAFLAGETWKTFDPIPAGGRFFLWNGKPTLASGAVVSVFENGAWRSFEVPESPETFSTENTAFEDQPQWASIGVVPVDGSHLGLVGTIRTTVDHFYHSGKDSEESIAVRVFDEKSMDAASTLTDRDGVNCSPGCGKLGPAMSAFLEDGGVAMIYFEGGADFGLDDGQPIWDVYVVKP